MTIEIIIIIAIIGVCALTGYLLNRREWNGGVCRKNGLRWQHFDTDSQGGRGYVAGDQYCWIGWPVDKVNKVI